jgi:hypothetical protein
LFALGSGLARATFHSLVETAKLHRVDPAAYLQAAAMKPS